METIVTYGKFLVANYESILMIIGFIGAMVTSVQAFRNGAKDRALEIAKTATAKVAVDLVGKDDDTKLEAAVTMVYDGLIELLKKETKVGPMAGLIIKTLIPKARIVEITKIAWHFYVKPAAQGA